MKKSPSIKPFGKYWKKKERESLTFYSLEKLIKVKRQVSKGDGGKAPGSIIDMLNVKHREKWSLNLLFYM